MINEISICGTACYPEKPTLLSCLKRINYLYGANGSGKTTIGRKVTNPDNYTNCSISCEHGTLLRAMIYNRDFIERDFNQPRELKGIFTLGAGDVKLQAKIKEAKLSVGKLVNSNQDLLFVLQDKTGYVGRKLRYLPLSKATDAKTDCKIYGNRRGKS